MNFTHSIINSSQQAMYHTGPMDLLRLYTPHARMAGYGVVCFESNVPIAEYMTVHLRQTNNTVELYAGKWVVNYSLEPKVLICSDSQYLVHEVSLRARSWRLHNWVGKSGPVSNPHLWVELLDDLDANFTASHRPIHW